jgi:AraC-like DNA-binding protein
MQPCTARPFKPRDPTFSLTVERRLREQNLVLCGARKTVDPMRSKAKPAMTGQVAFEGCSESAGSCMDWRVCSLLLSIDTHAGNVEWDLERACGEVKLDISPTQVARLFKRWTGQGIREYAKGKRLRMAAEMLTATDLPVKTIATEFGYQRPCDFARRFKKQYHLSPTEYRKRAAESRISRHKRLHRGGTCGV